MDVLNQSVLLESDDSRDLKQECLRYAEKVIGCELADGHPDFLLIDSSKICVEDAKVIIDFISTIPLYLPKKVVAIPYFDGTNEITQNKLLLTLEKGDAVFILATKGGMVLPTIRSRVLPVKVASKTGDLITVVSDGNEEIMKLFKEVLAEFSKQDLKGLLSALHLIKEKDSQMFYLKYPEYVGGLYRLLESALTECYRYAVAGIEPTLIQCSRKMDKKRLLDVLKELTHHRTRLSGPTYTKDHFFYIIGMIASL